MKNNKSKILVIGGGIAGLSAAHRISRQGIPVDIVEASPFLGGHAVQYACKATDHCVKCGACLVEEKLDQVTCDPNIGILTGSRVKIISKNRLYSVSITRDPVYIDPEKCTNCGKCFQKCPEPDAVMQGFSKSNHPFYAIDMDKCLNSKKQSCNICAEICPENAIDLKKRRTTCKSDYRAVIASTGFQPFSPKDKPYGYGGFDNVITNLDLERMFRKQNKVLRPSDKKPPQRIAFVQCVGSRDSKLNHLWCSRVCCGSAMRLANLIKSRHPETEITVFYMDIQTFGKDFGTFYEKIINDFRMIRSIPGDVFKTEKDQLRVTYYNACDATQTDDLFDLLVLAVGMTPREDSQAVFDLLDIPAFDFSSAKPKKHKKGIYTAGAVQGPMSIVESMESGENAAAEVLEYLDKK